MNPFDDPEMAAYWTAMIRDGVNPFRQFVTDPALFTRLKQWPAGWRVLDAGCGEGYLGRWWQKRERGTRGNSGELGGTQEEDKLSIVNGPLSIVNEKGSLREMRGTQEVGLTRGRVIGLDLSLALLQAARRAAAEEAYVGGSVFELPFAEGVFDGVVANFLLVEFAEPAAAIGEICRVLRPGGRFLFQGIHPFTFGGNAGQSGGRVEGYFTAQRFEEKFVIGGREAPLASPRYHHPLSTYMRALAECGFWIAVLEEPRPVVETPADHPIWEILREPWFLLIEAVKREIGD